jgi:hypothetical protein
MPSANGGFSCHIPIEGPGFCVLFASLDVGGVAWLAVLNACASIAPKSHLVL